MLGLQQSALVYGWRADASPAKSRLPADPMDLWRACAAGDVLLARSLLKAHPALASSVDLPHPTKGTTPLMAAAKDRAGAEAVRLLLELGADVRVADTQTRSTALHCAAQSPDALAAELLLAAGADVYALDAAGLMPIDVARRSGRADAARAIATHMQVHAGWLSVQWGDAADWRRWWGVLAATSADGANSELCLFRSPADVRPHAVVLIDPATQCGACASPSRSKKLSLSPAECPADCVRAFRLDRPVIYQDMKKNQRYTRDQSSGRTLSRGSVQIRELALAADCDKERDAWTAALTGDARTHAAWSPLGARAERAATERLSAGEGEDGDRCVICASARRNALCAPCGHLAACYPCLRAATLQTRGKCPICRARVHSVVRVFTS